MNGIVKAEERMDAEFVPVVEERALPAVVRSSVLLTPVMDVETAMVRLREFQAFVASYLHESKDGGNDGGDYGIIPGAGKKKVLFKQGADKLAEIYGLYDEYVIKDTVDWDRGLFDYDVTCILKMRRDDSIVGTGVGCCSSFESKYRFRDAPRKCPKCQAAGAIIKGKAEYGGGWLCFGKKGGCGAKFKDGDKEIEGQTVGRIENPDIADIKNTVMKMAKKRAKIDAVIGVTRSSGIFTQDMEDIRAEAPPPPPPPERAQSKEYKRTQPQDVPAAESVVEDKGRQADSVQAAPADSAPAFISLGQQANFAKSFREALPEGCRKDAEVLRHQWLAQNKFSDKENVPASAMIPAADWTRVKAAALAWASKCEVPGAIMTKREEAQIIRECKIDEQEGYWR